jgi:hypothetical protein
MSEVTRILSAIDAGDPHAAEQLLPLVYDELRKLAQLALAAAAKMKPLPKDEQNPLADNAHHDDLILWLAYKEAKAMMKFDEKKGERAP